MIKRQRKQAISASANIPQVQMTREQLLEVKRVNEERIQADRLRKMGVKVKDSMGVRYDIY